MKQPIRTERQLPSAFTYRNKENTYKIELIDLPLSPSTEYDFVWDAYRLEWHVEHTIDTWAEPVRDETLFLVVCIINTLNDSACLLLTSHVVTVVVSAEE
ncbi:hypothetical protein ACSX1A_00590 [Pontibacter sp. MBLB2868]|uniref:hypothetical protein n=1 Tax=Pontibacter sp. MBLB2868 TaxID=3451555 RepID=UPI003F74ECE5